MVTVAEFRRMALALPEATESSHMDHPDFRVGGKIFATLGYPAGGWGMVKLTPEQQQLFVDASPAVFVPAKGAWGARGATGVLLREVSKSVIREALALAWRNTAPDSLEGPSASRPRRQRRPRKTGV